MSGLEAALGGLSNLALRSKVRSDDAIDQLHHFVTATVLVCFAILTGIVEFSSDPINCWNSGKYQWKHYQDHVNTYCQTQPLYPYPNTSDPSQLPYPLGPGGGADNSSLQQERQQSDSLPFLHWASVFFLLQAVLFKLPNVVWREVQSSAGSQLQQMVEMLQTSVLSTPDGRAHTLGQLALFLHQWLAVHRHPPRTLTPTHSSRVKKVTSGCMVALGSWRGSSLSCVYLGVKALFLINTLLQFLLLSAFLHLNFWTFGVQAIRAYDRVDDVFRAHTGLFPLLVLCHFQTLEQTAPTGYWVQCILNINIFLEKLFLIEWFWMLVLLILTIISFCVWCFRILQTEASLSFTQQYLQLMSVSGQPPEVPPSPSPSQEQFVTDYLGTDGVFLLRLLAANTNPLVLSQLLQQLWTRYLALEAEASPDTEAPEVGHGKQPVPVDH